MPKYDCKYHGICRLDVDESGFDGTAAPTCGHGKGWLFIPQPKYCLICFDKRSMTGATRKTHFEREYFVLEEAVRFSQALAAKVGKQVRLQMGAYRIMEKEEHFGVLFGIHYSIFNKTEL
jgi:hypothetical protein